MTTYYFTAVAYGHVLAYKEDNSPSGVVFKSKDGDRDEEKWTVEYGEEPNTIALRCVANGKYLNSPKRARFNNVTAGDRQWWRMSGDNVIAPGAFTLTPADSPTLFLNCMAGGVLKKNHGGIVADLMESRGASVYLVHDRGSSLTRRL
jgi:hypothetical protein